MHHSSYKANGLYSRLCKPAAAFTLRLLLSFALIAGLNDSYAQSYMGPSFSITYPLSDYNSIDYSTYQTATNCGYNATDWSDGNVIKVGEGTVVVTTVSPVTYISFDFGALDEVNGETITFSGINGGGVPVLSSPNAGSEGCFNFSVNSVTPNGSGSNGKLTITSSVPFTQLTFAVTGLYSVIKVDNFTTSATIISPPSITITQPACGTTSGSITITNPSAGSVYSFDNGISFQSSAVLSLLAPGTYLVKIKNALDSVSAAVSATINPPPSQITPLFDPVAAICKGSTAPVLPLTSTNGVSGSWSSVVNTNVTGISNYTFTPAAGQCAAVAILPVNIINPAIPLFNQVLPVCAETTAPALPASSLNNIPGSWLPASINTAVAGTDNYTFTPSANQCATTAVIPVVINPKPIIEPVTGASRCGAGIINLAVSSTGSVKWYSTNNLTSQLNTGSSYNPFIDSTTIFYTTATSAAGCISNVIPVTAISNNVPVIFSLGNDTTLCPGNQLLLRPGNFAQYIWSDNSVASAYLVSKPGLYSVRIKKSDGCTGEDSIRVNFWVTCLDIFFPNSFSPNGDKRNDDFGPVGELSAVSDYNLSVYNRFGELVFKTNDPFKRWNGFLKNTNNMLAGNFVWYATYKLKGQGGQTKKGNLMLVK